MEEKIAALSNRIYGNKKLTVALDGLFFALMAVMSFIKVRNGLDITDSAYSCTNFVSLDSLDGMWYYSTFYANLLGRVLTFLPLGRTFLGLNIYTGMVKLLLAVIAYCFFVYDLKAERISTFLGVIAAISLSWCPTTILYNYLSYLFFLLGTIFLYKGLSEDKNRYLRVAGFFLGCNFFVRLPNVLEAGLIVALFIYCFLKKTTFKECMQKTGACIAGYLISFIPGCILILITRGFKEYIGSIIELFAMTDESASYSYVSMLLDVIRQYIETKKYIVLALALFVVCAVIFAVLPKKLQMVKYICSCAFAAGFVVLLIKMGCIKPNFHWFEPVFRYTVLILSISIIYSAFVFFSKNFTLEDKLLAMLSVLVIAITPLGSNNNVYTNLNNLFFVLPVLTFFTVRFVKPKEYIKGVNAAILVLLLAWSLISVKFGYTYIFRDGLTGPMNTEVKNNPQMAGMKTTAENAKRLSDLSDYWFREGLNEGTLLLYGDVSGLSFYLDTPVAISTAWPSLPSFVTAKFEEDITDLSAGIDAGSVDAPAIIIPVTDLSALNESSLSLKQEILKNFISKYKYKVAYISDDIYVLRIE